MKKVLIFFGTEEYDFCKKRLQKSANQYFDNIISYSEKDIDEEFYRLNIKIFSEIRGYGYWIWKPYFILKTLKELEENDICFYVDVTSVFISSPEVLFMKAFQSDGIVLFENANYQNYHWTKADCFNLMELTLDKYLYGRQVDAAFQLYRKNQKALDFLNELLIYSQNYNIISDAPNITGQNHPEYKQHRWDQSILSLLAIKYKICLAKSPRRRNNEFDVIIDLKRDVAKHPSLIVITK